MKKDIEKKLRSELELLDPGLVGCRRRAAWADESSWRWVSSNALLHVLGDKRSVYTPEGELQVYMLHDRWLLQFRGGQWNSYWMEDFLDLWSLVRTYGNMPNLSRVIIVLHENRGNLDIKQVEVPEALTPEHRAKNIIKEARMEPPARIPKSGARAYRVCIHCPVKARCDATDQLRGETDDWSPSYPQP